MAVPEERNPFRIAQKQLDAAATILRLDPAMHAFLRRPMRELHVSIPVHMDDGSVQVFSGYRVQYNNARGPCKGGIRFHPKETIDTVRALAAWMTWKCSLLDLPLGGGKGGVVCDVKSMSRSELQRLSRAYMRAIAHFIGPDIDVPAPDVYTDPQVMAWMMDEYSVLRGANTPGVITGKPLCLGGSSGRSDATARGGMYAVREAAKVLGLDLKGKRAAIQGYGNAGTFAHQLAEELLGMRVVAVSDSRGGIYNSNGLDLRTVKAHKLQTGSVIGLTGAEDITNQDLLSLNVTLLFPAALENSITGQNAAQIRTQILAELANGPTTPDADEVLFDRGVFVLPDFLCNAGGVTVSYFEQVQNAYNYYWPIEQVYSQLDRKITAAFQAMYEMTTTHHINHRTGAYLVAVSRVAEAVRTRGWV